MNNGSHTVAMMQLARMGFEVVPRVFSHSAYGSGLLHMNGNGLRFVDEHGQVRLNITWEQFDRGP